MMSDSCLFRPARRRRAEPDEVEKSVKFRGPPAKTTTKFESEWRAPISKPFSECAQRNSRNFRSRPRRATRAARHDLAHGPPVEAYDRAPLDPVMIVDRSGSMDGPKLALVKQTLTCAAKHLQPTDRLAVVAFDDESEVALPLTALDESGAKKAVEAINCGSSTNLDGASRPASRRYASD